MKFDDYGRELPDDTPIEIPLRFKRVANLTDRIRETIREELSRAAQSQGFETFEEQDDFEIGDDYDPRSRYELDDDQQVYPTGDYGGLGRSAEASGGGDTQDGDDIQSDGQDPPPAKAIPGSGEGAAATPPPGGSTKSK